MKNQGPLVKGGGWNNGTCSPLSCKTKIIFQENIQFYIWFTRALENSFLGKYPILNLVYKSIRNAFFRFL